MPNSADHSASARSPMLRVLYFAPKECWPLDTGAKIRNFHLARELARSAQVTYLGFSDEVSKRAGVANELQSPLFADPDSNGSRAVTVPYKGSYSPSKIVRGILGRTPISVLNYTTRAMARALKHLLDRQPFDVVQIESVHLFSYLPIIRAAKSRPLVVCDWHNIESELMWRYSEQAPSRARRLYARATARRLADLEKRALGEFDAHIVVSERDRDHLLGLAPAARLFVAENGVDIEHYSEADPLRDEANRNRIVYVGSMDYHPNIDAAVRFAREAWPAIRQQRPDLIFTVVGRSPSADVRALAALPGVEVTGTVKDVRPYYRESVAAVVPLRIGGGSRLKILEAMAAGVPVVSTRLGAEGLAVEDGRNIAIADSPEEMAAALLNIVRDDALARSLTAAARSFVRERYDWSAIGRSLLRAHLDLMGRARSLFDPADATAALAEI